MVTVSKPAGEVFEYVLEEDRDKAPEDQTVWGLTRLSVGQREAVDSLISSFKLKKGEIISQTNETKIAKAVLGYGLMWVRNLRDDESGTEITLERTAAGNVPDNFFEMIYEHANELSNAIDAGSKITKETAKN